jgi:hypothetical protein
VMSAGSYVLTGQPLLFTLRLFTHWVNKTKAAVSTFTNKIKH